MSFLARLAPHLPYLRRYARALTGDQTSGDNYVRATLEAVAAGERAPDAGWRPVWRSIRSSTPSGAPPARGWSRGRRTAPSSAIPPIACCASRPARAKPFCSPRWKASPSAKPHRSSDSISPRTEPLIGEAQAEIDAELATDVLIIEDEPVIAADIEALVRELGHQVNDIAATRPRRSTLSPADCPAWSWPTSSWPTAPRESTR